MPRVFHRLWSPHGGALDVRPMHVVGIDGVEIVDRGPALAPMRRQNVERTRLLDPAVGGSIPKGEKDVGVGFAGHLSVQEMHGGPWQLGFNRATVSIMVHRDQYGVGREYVESLEIECDRRVDVQRDVVDREGLSVRHGVPIDLKGKTVE